MVGTSMKILLHMIFLMKHSVGEGTITILRNKNIKEREETVNFLFLGELNCQGLTIEIIEEEI